MIHAIGTQRSAQRIGHLRLTDQFGKSLRAIPAIQGCNHLDSVPARTVTQRRPAQTHCRWGIRLPVGGSNSPAAGDACAQPGNAVATVALTRYFSRIAPSQGSSPPEKPLLPCEAKGALALTRQFRGFAPSHGTCACGEPLLPCDDERMTRTGQFAVGPGTRTNGFGVSATTRTSSSSPRSNCGERDPAAGTSPRRGMPQRRRTAVRPAACRCSAGLR